jgi:hypothetical protein
MQHSQSLAGGAPSETVQLAQVSLSFDDQRSMQGLLLAAQADSWRQLGDNRYGIASSRTKGLVYVVSLYVCTCPDWERRRLPCKHVIAVRLHTAIRAIPTA